MKIFYNNATERMFCYILDVLARHSLQPLSPDNSLSLLAKKEGML